MSPFPQELVTLREIRESLWSLTLSHLHPSPLKTVTMMKRSRWWQSYLLGGELRTDSM